MALSSQQRRNTHNAHFGGSIKTQPEEQTHRIHFPASICHLEQRIEEARHQSSLVEHLIQRLFIICLSAFDFLKCLKNIPQNDDIENSNKIQENSRNRGANEPTNIFERIKIL